jgi:hypothetical protein
MSGTRSDLTCEHGTLLAAWCAQCSAQWTPHPVDEIAGQGRSAA